MWDGSSGQQKSHKIRMWGLQPLFQIFEALLWVTLPTCDGGHGYSLCFRTQRQTLLAFHKSFCKSSPVRNMCALSQLMPGCVQWAGGELGAPSTSRDVPGAVLNQVNKTSVLPTSDYVESSAGEWNLKLSICFICGGVWRILNNGICWKWFSCVNNI